MTMDLRRLLEAALPAGVEWASLRRVRTATRGWAAKDGRFESATDGLDEGYMIEVLAGGQFGYAATPSSSPAALAQAASKALALAQAASGRAVHRFDLGVRPATTLHYESERRLASPWGADTLAAHTVKLSQAMRVSEKIVQTWAGIEQRDIESHIVSTSGADILQESHIVEYGIQALARDGTVTQRRTLNGPRGRTHQGGRELLDLDTGIAEAVLTAEQAIELLSAKECPAGRADLVLAPDQMMLQIHESVGHPLELDRILGDERNYAGSSFVKLSDIGSLRYGSTLMNITFDPCIPKEPASYGADDLGDRATREYLIKEGILVRAFGSLESQARTGLAGVANGRAQDWFRAPMDRMANLNLEPGTDSFEAIIGSIEKGVYMESNRSWSIDDYRNKFQFGCEYGRLIENGVLGVVVRNPNYRGISATFWRNLFKVGDPGTFQVYGTPNCGKGEPNQVITVGHASPVCAFRDVEIFGGEA